MNSQNAFPLQWPNNRPRAKSRTESQFGEHSIYGSCDAIIAEVKRLHGWQLVISTNAPLRKDGLPKSDVLVSDPGAAIYFRLNDKPVVLACDKWKHLACNLWAIAKHIEALRGQDRWGVGSVVQAFQGYLALPAPADLRPWWVILGVDERAGFDEARNGFISAAKRLHPDNGGSAEEMAIVNNAWLAAKRALGLHEGKL